MSKEIPLTQGYVTIVDDEDYEELMRHKWCVFITHSFPYAVRRLRMSEEGSPGCMLMHRQILDAQPGEDVDHRNHNSLDNRRANIRACSRGQHHANRRKLKGCSSRFKGVRWHKHRKKWDARIKRGGKRKHLGMFVDERDAARAYNEAAREYFGEFALLNEV